jgi:hypothetical protein
MSMTSNSEGTDFSILIKAASTSLIGRAAFLEQLDAEADRLSTMLESSKNVFNEKRLGVSASHIWLVLLQEFATAWTKQELGKAYYLRPSEIADLVAAGKISLGWDMHKSDTSAELISKAIRNFRTNPANTWIAGDGVKSYALERCKSVAVAPYLLGIEI